MIENTIRILHGIQAACPIFFREDSHMLLAPRVPSLKLKSEARNPKFETNSNNRKEKNSKRAVWMILMFGNSLSHRLFRISIFGFRIFFTSRSFWCFARDLPALVATEPR